jgi:hypothetical protein
MHKSSKFVMGVAGLLVTLVTALAGKMDANVMGCVVAICGGFMGANAAITRKALQEGKVES